MKLGKLTLASLALAGLVMAAPMSAEAKTTKLKAGHDMHCVWKKGKKHHICTTIKRGHHVHGKVVHHHHHVHNHYHSKKM
jgi:hypothetical protein